MKFVEYINEGGYSRLMQIMTGLVPTVKTFAIITWENPMNVDSDNKFNKVANKALKDALSHFSYKHIKGKYDKLENPFIIFNIGRSQAKRLAFDTKMYKQESIVFGKRFDNGKDVGVIMKMVYHDNRRPDVRRIWKSLKVSTGEMYSEYKGRKFRIPFLDDEISKSMTFKSGKNKVITSEDHNIYPSKYFSKSAKRKLNEMVDKILDKDRSGYSLYISRGHLNMKLNKLWTQSYSQRVEESK